MSTTSRFLIYGASGYTGTLVAEQAVERGHVPVLAGRSADKIAPLAERLGLDHVAFGLDDPAVIERAIAGFDLVFHAAGPFIHTSAPMVRACLAAGVNYVDVTGELPVFRSTFAEDARAKERGVCLISGVGFDVIPTDCLARYVAGKLPGATRLEIAFSGGSSPSAGTAKTAVEHLPEGNFVRRGGRLVSVPAAHEIRRVRFHDKERTVASIPWGDLETAYRSTGIGDITTYMAQSERGARFLRIASPVLGPLFRLDPVRAFVQGLIARKVEGPDSAARGSTRSQVWARAESASGESREAWLETLEGYSFTAAGGVLAVERLLELRPTGALTPSMAFGADFVLEVEGTTRYDSLL